MGLGCLFVLEGCLSNTYQISHAELVRLAQRPPESRGEHLRALQQTSVGADDVGSEEEEGTPREGTPGTPGPSGSVTLSTEHEGGAPLAHRAAHASDVTGHNSSGYGISRHGVSGHGESKSSSGSGSGGVLGGGKAEDAIVIVAIAVVAANGVGIALAAVEGSRFDGWVSVPPDQPLLLISRNGDQWLPLAELTERDAATADHGVIVDRASVQRLGRAPLDRKGFVYEVELGAATLNAVGGTRDLGFACRTGVGYFPTQALGLLFADQVAFGSSHDRNRGAIFNGRIAAELEFLPVQAGRFHAGFYGELGGALALQDLPDRSHGWSGLFVGGGFLAQIDWTTRLALNLRGGIAALPAHPASTLLQRSYVPELTVGISVY